MQLSPARLAADALRLLPRKRISRALGAIAKTRAPQPLVSRAIDAFVSAYDVDMAQAIVPSGGYRSFDDFFTRALEPGARPIDADPSVIISPADGKIEDFGAVDLAASVTVKGKPYRVGDLLGDVGLGDAYQGGNYFIVYLSPRDYHRVHTPVAGRVTAARHVPGTLYPVNRIGTDFVPRLFARNERVVTLQDSPEHGQVVTIMVGAIGVGHISMSYDNIETNVGRESGLKRYGDSGVQLARGAELGVFHLGSTAVVFLPPGAPLDWRVSPGDMVRMGQRVAVPRRPR
jgi:phosphatidylserine decarboxylase